ncbi:MAG: lipid-A-disaccharide synthase [Dissulfurimicrobium sp.]|uniref:lipid-A-disaccharide synthase n=1 Tax=Dissulfurimicrobium TaxID=1769732 RepID=UPI001ED9C6BD|nr:lipid-A-disaccharide synthase [Dissulfurimicrobium hydrothermale]UKL13737.1 lipid-A-disaccharide synthase [Dissulfurimicrobium hydrothermale]
MPDHDNFVGHQLVVMSKSIFIIAGEASGDLHGSGLIRAIKAKLPDCKIAGIGGPKMVDAGLDAIFPSSRLAVVGLAEIFAHTWPILSAFYKTRVYLKKERPDLLILIDYPEFNLLMAGYAKGLGIPVFYYISPQVWAWRQGRVRRLKRSIDEMAVILPFEEDFFSRYGLKVRFVGHPLLDSVKVQSSKEEFCRSNSLSIGSSTVGLLPGSRHGEVQRIFPVMADAACLISRLRPSVQFVAAVAPSIDIQLMKDMARACAGRDGPDIRLIQGRTYDVMAASNLVIAASGTVTLEAAILGVPLIVTYKVSPLSYHLGRHLIKVPYASLVNLVAGRMVAPEFLQNDATPEAIANEALAILGDDARRERMVQDLAIVTGRLGQPGAADRAANIALGLLKRSNPASR